MENREERNSQQDAAVGLVVPAFPAGNGNGGAQDIQLEAGCIGEGKAVFHFPEEQPQVFHLMKNRFGKGHKARLFAGMAGEKVDVIRYVHFFHLQNDYAEKYIKRFLCSLGAITKAPLEPYEHAEALRCLFEARRHIKDGELFITYTGEAYPW